MRILIVEDDASVARALQERLTRLNYQVVGICASGDEALVAAQAAAPEVVLMDIVLQGEMDGIETAVRLREVADAAVIFLTAYDDPELLQRATQTKAFAYLLKPLKDSELRVTLEMAYARQQAERQQRQSEQAWHLAAEQTRQMQKMEAIGRLAGGVAHDFNNMLTAINGYSDLVLRQLPDADPLRAHIEKIRQAGTRAASLTQQLLAFSRRQMLQPTILDLNAMVTIMREHLAQLLGDRIVLQLRLDADVGKVRVDPGQIEQVLVNLASNARDAQPQGGAVVMETANVTFAEGEAPPGAMPPGEYVRLTMRDSGCGMDAETQAKIFEPFFTTAAPNSRMGLGLATAYGIIKQSGGDIRVESEAGKGATFTIYLPRFDRPASHTQELAVADASRATGRGVILVVEDEETVRTLVRGILEANGYTVLTAAHGGEALDICRDYAGAIELMITDVMMPQMSGRQLADEAAALRPQMRILFMSGYTDDAFIHHGVHDEQTPFIQKPFTLDALLRKVSRLLE